MSRPDPDRVEAAIAHLRRLSSQNKGKFPTDIVEATAKELKIGVSTMWRYLKEGPPAAGSEGLSLNDRQLEALAAANGNGKIAWESLTATGEYDRGYRQFMRDINALPPVIRTGLTRGVAAGIGEGLFLKSAEERRLDRVIFDHTEADIRLQRMHAGKLEMFRPWISLLLDSSSRFVLAGIMTEGDGLKGDPNTESLVALMAAAIRGTTAADGSFVGGVPRLVQCDNAKAHIAEAMLNGFTTLGIAGHLIRPGSPWEDGKVERLMHTFNSELLSTLPGYTAVVPDRYSHETWKPEDCLTAEEFAERFQQWIDYYNYDRVHASLGCTPFEKWRSDDTVLNRVDDALIRSAFLASSRPVSVSKNGVRFRKVDYIHSKLRHLRGKKVTLRYLPNDRTFVDVYADDVFVCTAVPHTRLSSDERIAIVRERSAEAGKVDRIIKRSRKRRSERELTDNPFLAPERDPDATAAHVDTEDPDEEFLRRLEGSSRRGDADSSSDDGGAR